MRVLLTGATGLVGPHLLERFVARGDTVQVLALPETVEQVLHRDRVKIIQGNLADSDALAKATKGVEVVYHLAALLPGHGEPQDYFRINVDGTENLLRASVASQVRRFVFTSSVSVYSPAPWPFMWPITEDHPQRAHGNDDLRYYGQSKIDAEDLICQFHHEYGLEYVILRATVAYGAGGRPGFLGQIMNNPRTALTRQINGMQCVHATDLAEAIVLAGTRPEAANDVFNVAGGETVTTRDITIMLWEIMYPALQLGGAQRFRATIRGNHAMRLDLSKAQSVLGYTPQVKLREGLEELLAAMDQEQLLTPQRPRWFSRGYWPTTQWQSWGAQPAWGDWGPDSREEVSESGLHRERFRRPGTWGAFEGRRRNIKFWQG